MDGLDNVIGNIWECRNIKDRLVKSKEIHGDADVDMPVSVGGASVASDSRIEDGASVLNKTLHEMADLERRVAGQPGGAALEAAANHRLHDGGNLQRAVTEEILAQCRPAFQRFQD